MGDLFVISDTHFGHRNILKFEPLRAARWSSVDEMDEGLVELWNDTVRPTDTVFHLGDVWLGRRGTVPPVDRLNGRKLLLPGNHDHIFLKLFPDMFDEILTSAHPIGNGMVLSHVPLHPRGLSRGSTTRWGTNIHGHIHSGVVYHERGWPDQRYFNASVEMIGFRPFPLDLVQARSENCDMGTLWDVLSGRAGSGDRLPGRARRSKGKRGRAGPVQRDRTAKPRSRRDKSAA